MFDLIIRNGMLIDGSGGTRVRADVGVTGGRITALGGLAEAVSKEEIDASGLLVMPGFIDSHCHSDMALLHDRQHVNGLCQGITSEILGQDGLSYAPLSKLKLEDYTKYLAGLNGFFGGVALDFQTVEEYLLKFDDGTAVNAAYLIPHGAIRYEAMGFQDRPLAGREIDKAKDLMRAGFEQGAVGFSTGLSYYPCAYADTDELAALCEVCTEYDAPFVIHLRTVFRGAPFDRVGEAIEIARRSGCRLHFSHYRTRPGNEGRPELIMENIEKAMDEGIRITLELYPYYSGAGYAVVFLPPWAVEGGWAAAMERLRDTRLRARIIEGVKQNSEKVAGTFTHLVKNERYIGMDFKDVAKERGQDVHDMILDILLEEEMEVGYYLNPAVDEETGARLDADYVGLLKRPYYMVGSDSIPIGPMPHPRAFGTFPRFLRLFREHSAPFEIFANRVSALPASTFGLKDRGMLKEGFFADIVVLSENDVTDTAEYGAARRAPRGIRYVVVNGCVELWDEKVNGSFAGRALRRNI